LFIFVSSPKIFYSLAVRPAKSSWAARPPPLGTVQWRVQATSSTRWTCSSGSSCWSVAMSLGRGRHEDERGDRDDSVGTSNVAGRRGDRRVILLQPVRLTGGWWLVLVCSERRVLLAGCWWLICCERKVLLAGGW
jgi:hypothetical protein